MKARVLISPKKGIADPQGTAVERALHALGFADVRAVRVGKVIDMELPEGDRVAALAALGRMSEQLLANTVVETYSCSLVDEDA
ncbi:MAG: phosphoribosylformylglycinamidine synthase subunit PurS [Candidatus Cryosericum sp.]